VSLIYSMLGEVWSFFATPAAADRRGGGSCESVVAILFKHPENHSRLCVRGTRHAEVVWVSCAVPGAAPSSAVFARRHDRDFRGLASDAMPKEELPTR